jgi:hypothetical protein
MSLEEIRRKAQKFQTSSRLSVIASTGTGIVLCVLFARASVREQSLVPRIGWGVLSLWGLYTAYQAHRWIWPGGLAANATLHTCLAYYRRELENRRDYGRHIWRRSGLPVAFAAIAIILVPPLIRALATPQELVKAAPFFILIAIWFAIVLPKQKRDQQKLQREIDELDVLERGTQ